MTAAGERAHHPRVLWSCLRLEQGVAKWRTLDDGLKELAVMASAASVGCSWCMDFGYWESHRRRVDPRKPRDVPAWRASDAYSPLERDVMAYAEAVTATPPAVDDDLAERLRGRLGEPALVELTTMIAVENLRSRFDSAMGLTSQGFKDSCDLRDAGRPAAR
ncbi:carboxymuconolactone decarboxylase family protein [Streptomyces sp. NPDC052114]|uniref:carboxymuconolactone decarboxylase family protein n=1 Tax=unclassified Streptomyces TaxID=2593676 RepID=UPI0034470AAB